MSLKDKTEVLWIGPFSALDGSGEVIYDRKIAPALNATANVSFYRPPRVASIIKLMRMLHGQAWHWASYHTRQSLFEVRERAKTADVVVCSWEKYDGFSEVVERPVVLILHNITSDTVFQVFPQNFLARVIRWRTLVHETKIYTMPNVKAIFVLSQHDKRLVEEMGADVPVVWAPPGMPPAIPLADSARFAPALTFSGSYGWFPKRRDLGRFFQDVHTLGLGIESDETIPEKTRSGVPITPAHFTDLEHCAQTLRIGVIPDRFVAGHKLKAGFYIAHNAIVLSYADIREEFNGLPHAEDFVRFVTGPRDLKFALDDFATRDSASLRKAFSEFQRACTERFSWQIIGTILRDEVLAVASSSRSSDNA